MMEVIEDLIWDCICILFVYYFIFFFLYVLNKFFEGEVSKISFLVVIRIVFGNLV